MNVLRATLRTPLGWIAVVVTLMLTWGSLWAVEWGFQQIQPVESSVSNVTLIEAPVGTGGRTLQVDVTMPAPGNCIRMATAFLHKDAPGVPTFYLLGTTFNGYGFGARGGALFDTRMAPGRPMSFVMVLPVPSSIPDGKYQFIYGNLYSCQVLGGLLVWRIPYAAPPVTVWVGPH
jgi:hypothetical protein